MGAMRGAHSSTVYPNMSAQCHHHCCRPCVHEKKRIMQTEMRAARLLVHLLMRLLELEQVNQTCSIHVMDKPHKG